MLLVAGEDDAEPVGDQAAFRRDQPFADAVGLGQGGVFAVLHHLQIIEFCGDRAEQAGLRGTDDNGAAREGSPAGYLTFHVPDSGQLAGGGAAMRPDEPGGQCRIDAGAGHQLRGQRQQRQQ